MVKDGYAVGTSFSRTDPKFMIAALGETKHTIFLHRGFRQYGQPSDETLEAFVEIKDDDNCEAF